MESLLDPVIDSSHRSFFAAVEHRALQVLRPHPPTEIVSIHPDWVDRYVLKYYSSFHFFTPISILTFLFLVKYFRLHEAGLLNLGRLVEGGLFKLD